MIGNTRSTLERNIIIPLRNIWGDELIGRMKSDGRIKLFGRDCWALGADRINQVSKLQGMSISYCYGDEVTTWNKQLFDMLKSRLDRKNACFDGTCNPDSPTHWFKQFLESDADIYLAEFTIDDNPYLDPLFVESLKREYTGTVFYDRYILGLWTAAEGVIYRQFADNPNKFILKSIPPDEIMFAVVGIDFGGNGSAHAFNLTGFTEGFKQVITLDEYYKKEIISPIELETDLINFIKKNQLFYRIVDIYCDSAEQTLIEGLRVSFAKNGIYCNVNNARKGSIIDRIRLYSIMQSRDQYKLLAHCTHTIHAFCQAVWDEKSTMSDKRLDNGYMNIDSLDAQEYSTEAFTKDILNYQ